MSPRSFLLCASLLLLFPGAAAARQERVKKQGAPAEGAAPAAGKAKRHTQLAVARVRDFVEQASNFRDDGTRLTTLAHLADLLWKEDEPYARSLFMKVLGSTAVKGEMSSEKSAALVRLRLEVLALLGRRDPALAGRLAGAAGEMDEDEAGRAKSSASLSDFGVSAATTASFKIAYDLAATQPERSVEFARQSLRGGVFPYMNLLLLRLRTKSEAAANALFLESLSRLMLDTPADPDTLVRLGTYVFTSPRIDPRDPNTQPDTIMLIGVGDMLITDITADRPGVPPPLIRAYLEAAARLAMGAPPGPDRRPRLYAAEYLLLPKFERYAPELAPQFSSAMQSLGGDVPRELTKDSAYTGFKETAPKDLDEVLREVGKEQDEQTRDAKLLALAADCWRRDEFGNARAVADRMTDEEARDALAALIDFREGARLLEGGKDYAEVERLAGRLPQGIESAVLWLGLASAYKRGGAAANAGAALNSALAAARHVEDGRRPFLLLSAASQMARFDPVLAQQTLAETVKEFNARKRGGAAPVGWEQRVEAGPLWRTFPLQIKGVGLDLEQTLPPLLEADLEGTLSSLKNLNDERELAQVFRAAAAVILK